MKKYWTRSGGYRIFFFFLSSNVLVKCPVLATGDKYWLGAQKKGGG